MSVDSRGGNIAWVQVSKADGRHMASSARRAGGVAHACAADVLSSSLLRPSRRGQRLYFSGVQVDDRAVSGRAEDGSGGLGVAARPQVSACLRVACSAPTCSRSAVPPMEWFRHRARHGVMDDRRRRGRNRRRRFRHGAR